MSTHRAEVIKIDRLLSHPNADSLERVKIGDYPCCVRKGDFKPGDLAIFIEPDSLVPVDQPEFSFLADRAKQGYARIRAVKLRGLLSYGLLVKARPGQEAGQDVMKEMGILHWQPPESGGEDGQAPCLYCPKYDLENYQRYPDILQEGEDVVVTEKLNGENWRYTFHNNKSYVGSHGRWKSPSAAHWWRPVAKYNLEEELKRYNGYIFFAELYGKVKGFKYGHDRGDKLSLAFFDIMYQGEWLGETRFHRIMATRGLPRAPVLYRGPWQKSLVELADGPSTMPGADHIREGIVVKPATPRNHEKIGRVALKIVSGEYLASRRG